ncbi:tabserin-like [Prorops nasuta]|uniref:tabserin-like n=1 Tax=Prorops nasuta TaxID=863751 RepID=UPI0034CF10D9
MKIICVTDAASEYYCKVWIVVKVGRKMERLSLFCLSVLLVIGNTARAEEPLRIVGGRSAVESEIPYIASLRVHNFHVCGASIIGPHHVLTAAHCVDQTAVPPYKNFHVYVGSNNVSDGIRYEIKRITKHPRYTGRHVDLFVNDIAVITLKKAVTESKRVKIIPLADSPPVDNDIGFIAGWGMTSVGSRGAERLKVNLMRVLTAKKCRPYHEGLHDTQVCVFNQKGEGACNGDSGGPFVVKNKLVGIASWVIPCAQGYPDGFTCVYSFRPWIRSVQAQFP